MNIIFIAPPAAGKGTQSKKICAKYNIPHISTGDLLRSSTDPEIQRLLEEGKLVSDEIITNLLKERLSKEDCQKGFILDGYPRNINQAVNYDNILKELDKPSPIVIIINLDEQTAQNRIVGRKICPNCGKVYNELILTQREKEQNICDNCHHELVKRSDDNEVTFKNRYEIYKKESEQIIKHYEDLGTVYHIDGNKTAEEVFDQIDKILGGTNDNY